MSKKIELSPGEKPFQLIGHSPHAYLLIFYHHNILMTFDEAEKHSALMNYSIPPLIEAYDLYGLDHLRADNLYWIKSTAGGNYAINGANGNLKALGKYDSANTIFIRHIPIVEAE